MADAVTEDSINPISASLLKACLEHRRVGILLQGRHVEFVSVDTLTLPPSLELSQLGEMERIELEQRVGLQVHDSPFVILEGEFNIARSAGFDAVRWKGRLAFNSEEVAVLEDQRSRKWDQSDH